jgi:glutathione S-transferase
MIALHTMAPVGWGLLAPSPFCLKAELCLRMAGRQYTLRPTLTADRAPRGKLPWAEDGAVVVEDSQRLVEHLQAAHGDPLGDLALSAAQRGRAHLARRVAETSLYFALVDERWRDPEVRAAYAGDLLAALPALARPWVRAYATRALLQQGRAQGTSRRPREEVTAEGAADLDALAVALGDDPWFTGDRPTSVDAAVFGQLANLWYVPVHTPLRRALAARPSLVAFLERVRTRWVSDVPVRLP